MSKYERCREDVVAHFEFAIAQPDHQPCPACKGTGKGRTTILGMGRTVTEEVCRVCAGTGCNPEGSIGPTIYELARGSVDRYK